MRATTMSMSLVLFGCLACSPAEREQVREEVGAAGATVEQTVKDGTITAAVKAKLLADQQVNGINIDVDTTDAVVTLSGKAQNGSVKARAVELAVTTPGVVRVQDRLVVSE
jgi:hyperosmotically inducible protein